MFVAVYGRWPMFGELPGSVAVIHDGARFLLHHRSDGLGWDFPGGVSWPWESAEQTLRREVAEETGLKIQSARHLFTYSDRQYIPSRIRVFGAAASGRPRGSWEGEAEWKELAEVRGEFFLPHRSILAWLDSHDLPL